MNTRVRDVVVGSRALTGKTPSRRQACGATGLSAGFAAGAIATTQAFVSVGWPEVGMLQEGIVALKDENTVLAGEIQALEDRLERSEEALCDQELYIMRGYLVALWPDGKGGHVAACPTLHASVQGASKDAAVQDLRDAVETVVTGFEHLGRSLPPRDVDSRCLD